MPPITETKTTTDRIFNFSAGPCTLPEPVLRQAQDDIWNIFGTGIGILEHSHRGPAFNRVMEEAEADCRRVGGISDDYEVLFLQGGATLQFAMIPMSFLPSGATADYVDTGAWTTKAIKDARKLGDVNVAFDGGTCDYTHVPSGDEISWSSDPAYAYYCSNNTVRGTEFAAPPSTTAPLVCDASSDIYSRPLDLDGHVLVYAGAQKNLGPAGCTLVIIRKDFLERAAEGLPSMLDYRIHAKKGSRYNTPPCFSIYFMGHVFKWIQSEGGLGVFADRNARKAGILYDAVDASGGFFQHIVRPDSRSNMNVVFRTPNPDLDAAFVKEALANGMSGLKGHRSVGGLRASIYNAFPEAGCTALAGFMADFARRNG